MLRTCHRETGVMDFGLYPASDKTFRFTLLHLVLIQDAMLSQRGPRDAAVNFGTLIDISLQFVLS